MSHYSRLFALGPEGTFSDAVAQRLRKRLEQPQLPIVYTRTIPEVMNLTEADPTALGVFPIENSVTGTINPAQDALVQHDLTVLGEMVQPVQFGYVAHVPPQQVERVYAHPQAVEQCAEFITTSVPKAQLQYTRSNMESATLFAQHAAGEAVGAIVPMDHARQNALLQATNIQDYPHNTTRFLVVQQRQVAPAPDFALPKTSLLVEPGEDHPGLLYDILSIFKAHKLNLVRLESRPAKVKPWTYVFFMDVQNNDNTPACLEDLRKTSGEVTVLGSYVNLDETPQT